MIVWGDNEDSSSKDELKETTNICFMAQEDEVSSTSHLNSNFNIDELLEAYNELMIEFKKLHKKEKETNLLNKKIKIIRGVRKGET